jgi:hypothetical protein
LSSLVNFSRVIYSSDLSGMKKKIPSSIYRINILIFQKVKSGGKVPALMQATCCENTWGVEV